MKTIISISKAKKPRQVFLSALMRKLSGDSGDEISNLYVKGNRAQFVDRMMKLVNALADTMTQKG